MTVRVTTLKGEAAGAYYVEQLPNYYLQSGEPRGVWVGDGAEMLDLVGDVADDAFLAVMAGMDPQRPDRLLGRRYDESSVRGFDVTASAPKSVSILFALGDDDVRDEVLAAHDAAVVAMAGWIERHAHTRYRIGGEVAVVDAEGIVAARFRQHTSRALDPQLHTHLVIANRVRSPDGRWLALDARTIKKDQRTLSAIYHAGLRAELTRRLGVRWNEPDHGIAEIADVPEILLLEFSARTAAMRHRLEDKLDRFLDSMGRVPTPRERWCLEREAVLDSRPPKATAPTAADLHDGWWDQVRALGLAPERVVDHAVGQVTPLHGFACGGDAGIVTRAVEAISEQQSTWRPTELVREIAPLHPTDTAESAEGVVRWAEGLAAQVAVEHCVDVSRPIPPGALLRRDGRPVTEAATDRALTTQAILDQEHSLIVWADRRLTHAGGADPSTAAHSDVDLTVPQADAAGAVAGHDDVVFVVGPAGTGKTTALRPAVAHLRSHGRAVFGVAPSAAAADVLSEETGIAADTVDKLLVEHRLDRPPDHRYDLPVGASVIVDEAGMLPTAKLTELADLADTRGWRIALVGDPLQFTAVGRGGMFGLLVDTFGAIELDQVHRFEHDWERQASLRLRAGDIDVAEIYEQHGRLHAGTVEQMERAAVARWWDLRQQNMRELLVTPTNEAAERLNVRCQRQRIRAGELDPDGGTIDLGAFRLHVGDEIATRHNDRRLRTDHNDMVRNRATWTIDAIHPDGSLTATGNHGTIRLPQSYVAQHVELAYAHTVMAAQGRNVDGGLLYADRPMDIRTLYVALTRGIQINEAFFAVIGEQTGLDVMIQSMATDWIDLPATSRQAELHDTEPHRPGLLDGPALRELIEQRRAITTCLDEAESLLHAAPRARDTLEREIADARRTIARANSEYRRAEQFLDTYDRPLRRRTHAADIEAAANVLQRQPEIAHHATVRIETTQTALDELAAQVSTAKTLNRRRPDLQSRVAEIDELLDHDRRVRTRIARLEQPPDIVDTLGPRPRNGPDARLWDQQAGRLHQHQATLATEGGSAAMSSHPAAQPCTAGDPAIEPLRAPATRDGVDHSGPAPVELVG